MISVEILDTKKFMQKLLASESFDSFYLESASITTFNTFQIDGHMVKAFFAGTDASGNDMEMPSEFSTWKQMRQTCFDLIKGNRSPVAFQITLYAGDNYMHRLHTKPEFATIAPLIKALGVNIRFENNKLILITATSYQSFVMDKRVENAWDEDFIASLTAIGIPFTLL